MIDLITLTKSGLSSSEIDTIVEWNNLQTNSADGLVYYDNLRTKNLIQQAGIFVCIDTKGKLKVEGSLHKYYNEMQGLERNNYNLFKMSEAKQAFDMLVKKKQIGAEMHVYGYEIGLNLPVSKDCRLFMDKMNSIGPSGNERRWIEHSRYKDERMKTTLRHKDVKKYYKVYDKVFEMLDKKKKLIQVEENILRVETVFRRMNKMPAEDFFSESNLKKIAEQFFRDWRTIQFEKNMITPKGTGRAKQALCRDILRIGREKVLEIAREKKTIGVLSNWEIRNIREFITHEWDEFKKEIKMIDSPEEVEFRRLLTTYRGILLNDDFINE